VSEAVAPPPPVRDQRPPRRRRLWLALVLLVAIPVASFFVLGGLALQMSGWRAFSMPSGSMLPSLLVGDYFFVNRTAYADGRQPRRGDIVVFRVPDGAGALARWNGQPVEFVKRVIGLPGERIEMRKGVPVINGQPAVQTRVGDFDHARPGLPGRSATRLREAFSDGTTFEMTKYSRNGPADEGGPVIVPDGSFFVMGDNRDDSLDSRSGWWVVPAANLIGPANYIYWSGFERFGRIGTAVK
jgi:signal peptidase I